MQVDKLRNKFKKKKKSKLFKNLLTDYFGKI